MGPTRYQAFRKTARRSSWYNGELVYQEAGSVLGGAESIIVAVPVVSSHEALSRLKIVDHMYVERCPMLNSIELDLPNVDILSIVRPCLAELDSLHTS